MNLLLTNATLVDVLSKKLQSHANVLIKDHRIVEISITSIEEDTVDLEIDCKGKYLLPGLMDMHIHLHAGFQTGPTLEKPVPNELIPGSSGPGLISRLHSYLYCGVTSVYDAGNDAPKIFSLRKQERENSIISPRIFCAGSIVTCPGGHGNELGIEIASLPLDLPKLDQLLDNGPDLVKITYDEHGWNVRPMIPILSMQTLRDIVEHCHNRKFRVTVHTSNEIRGREAIACGVDCLAHPVIQSPVNPEYNWLLAEKHIPMVSTLTIGDRYPRLASTPEYLDQSLYKDCIPSAEREQMKTEESKKQKTNPSAVWHSVMGPIAQINLKMLVESGGILVTGTDMSSGPDYHRELELLQNGGINPFDIIVAATHNAAYFLSRTQELGAVHVGKLADLILVDEDPTKDVNNLKKISLVVKNGTVIDRRKLDLPVNANN
jgi:imidazolonepropionase-like amidohydrolase